MTPAELDFCTDGFHSGECPMCGLTADERDDPANATNAAMDYGAGYAAGRAAAREPAGAGLREAVKALARSMDDWLASWPAPSPDDRTAIRAWHTSLRAALASPAEPGLGHGDHPNDGYLYEGCPGCHPAREPAGAGLREALERHLDRIKDGLDHGNIADDCSTMDCPIYLGIESWDAVLRALASPAEPGLDAMARYILAHGEHSPFCAYTRGGEQCDCGLREAMDAALALSGPKP